MTTGGTCRQCGRAIDSEDFAKLAAILYHQRMCTACYKTSKAKGYAAQALRCPVCDQPGATSTGRCERCYVADRVGADMFECDCGARVVMVDSVRMMRKGSHKIERVCKDCSLQGTCAGGTHPVVTARHKDWDPTKFTFQPLPDGFQAAYCSVCGMAMYWDGQRWSRMTWTVLAEAWEKADA